MLVGRPLLGNSRSNSNSYTPTSSLPSPQSITSSWNSDACPFPKYCDFLALPDCAHVESFVASSVILFGFLYTWTKPCNATVMCVIRIGLMTVRTTRPFTVSPGEYRRCGSLGRMWKSVRLRVRDRKGDVSLENNDRPVVALGSDEVCGDDASAFMLLRTLILSPSVDRRFMNVLAESWL